MCLLLKFVFNVILEVFFYYSDLSLTLIFNTGLYKDIILLFYKSYTIILTA